MNLPLAAPGFSLCGRRGFTLIELVVTLAVVAILLAVAVPSMRELIARKRVEGVASELATDLRYLRSTQIQRRQSVKILFGGGGGSDSCYVLATSPSTSYICDCTRAAPICIGAGAVVAAEVLKTVVVPVSTGVTLSANPTSLALGGFSGEIATQSTIAVSVKSALGGELQVSTNAAMTPTICTVGGKSTWPAC